MTEESKPQRRKPTIHELEAILSEEDPGKITLNADGSVTVKSAWTDAELTQLVKAARALMDDLVERAKIGQHHPSADIRAAHTGSKGELIIQAGNGVLENMTAALVPFKEAGK